MLKNILYQYGIYVLCNIKYSIASGGLRPPDPLLQRCNSRISPSPQQILDPSLCCVHLIISVALLCKDIAVIVAVPLFQWDNPYTKITTPLHALGHKTRMANDIAILFSDLAFLIMQLLKKISQKITYRIAIAELNLGPEKYYYQTM